MYRKIDINQTWFNNICLFNLFYESL